MSQRDVERALGRLLTDEQFRRDFYQFPASACVALGIQLTEHELEALVATPRSALAGLGSQLDDRICRLSVGSATGWKPSGEVARGSSEAETPGTPRAGSGRVE